MQTSVSLLTKPRQFTVSFTGRKLGPSYSAPSLQDIGVCLGRLCRYAGNGKVFYPVLLHSFVVADLLPSHLKIYGLLHDSTEAILNDVPSPFKVESQRQMEQEMFVRILNENGVPPMNAGAHLMVERADHQALLGEFFTVGPTTIEQFADGARDYKAEIATMGYTVQYGYDDLLRPDGAAVLEFHRRFQDYKAIAEAYVDHNS